MRKNKKIQSPLNNSEHLNSSTKSLSKLKKIIFRIIMVLLPFVILLLIETGLRIFNYGGNLDLFVLQKKGEISEYVLNKNFTKRYFFQKGIKTPIPLSQTFSAKKDSLTYRIFCLGASTVQGFPYPPNGGFPAMLENILSSLHPDRNIEVINCGITAITSFSVLDMSEEILDKYQPDLLVVYCGHNEFYGVLGQASRLSLFENHTMQRLFLKLQDSKLFLLVRDIINSLFGKDINDEQIHHETLMALVAENVGIRLNDDIVKRTEASFQNNIEDMIQDAKSHGTNILICNLATNLKDFAPFASLHSNGFTEKDSVRWSKLANSATEVQSKNRYDEAIDLYLQALKIDSEYANTHYQLGICYYNVQNYKLAKEQFELARDYDVIRFRAPSSFNRILKRVCNEYRVPMVDIEKTFCQLSPHGIIGNDLLFEHVHPNQRGYLEIGKDISKVMSAYSLIKKSWDWTKVLPDSDYYAMSKITILDREVVNYMLFRLTSYWPFNNYHKSNDYVRIGNEETEKLTRSFIDRGKGSLVELHLEYGQYLQNSKLFDKAVEEYKAALAIEPVRECYNRLGQIYMAKTEIAYKDLNDFNIANENFVQAVSHFNDGLKRWPDSPELNFNLALLYFMRNDKLKESEEHFKKVLTAEPKHEKSLRLLSELYVRENRYEDAKNTLIQAIEYHPSNAIYYTSMGIIFMKQRQLNKAKNYLEKAINLGNDNNAKYYMQKLNIELKKINN